ncbi:mandelate racemase/muconate lactonizing enzyme family protein [Halobellus salinisoli]|uniref:mandelate racemase/muconate lactonizing enzyme family protein n=1 Tax=Halobellus salinisoli TaxID=3108500 RepID=UPI00300B9C4D
MDVQITDIETYIIESPSTPWVLLRVETDAGVHGIGEGTVHGKARSVATAVENMRDHFIGAAPFDTERLWQTMYRDEWFAQNLINTSVISAVDIACWDIKGKILDVPLYELLGGKVHEELRTYANGWCDMHRCSPEEFAAGAADVIADGYDALKFDPFGTSWQRMTRAQMNHAIEIIRAVREAVGPSIDLFLEGHGRFTPGTAVEIADKTEDFDLSWFEEPTPPDNLDTLRQVAATSTVPIATGERAMAKFGFRDILSQTDVDVIQPDLANAGGITEGKKIAALAEAEHVSIAPHNPQSPLMTAVYAHIDSTLPNFMIQEVFEDYSVDWRHDLFDTPVVIEDGFLQIPNGPGIGVDLNPDVVAEHELDDGDSIRTIHHFEGGWEEEIR